MTSKTTAITQKKGKPERFPEYPPRDDMQNWLYLYDSGIISTLGIHFSAAPNITVASEVPISPALPIREDVRIPDLLMVRDADRALIEEQRGYAIDSQGKAPDFVLEVASPTTGVADYTDKRSDYERYGVGEYWRFDPSGGDYHDAALAGDVLVDGNYEPIAIEMLEGVLLRGYSAALGLYVCWEGRHLRFYDPVEERYLPTPREEVERAAEERAGRLVAEGRAESAMRRAGVAEERAEEEHAGRLNAESRVAELEAELRRLRGE